MSESERTGADPHDAGGRDRGQGEGPRGEDRRRRFDPRFSPAFQPGYDARVHREAPPSSPLREGPRDDWSLAGRGVSAPADPVSRTFLPVTEGGDAVETGADFPIFALPEDTAEAPDTDLEPEETEPVAWWRRINPWLFVLWALGIAILLFAFQFANAVFEGAFQPNPNDPGGYFMSMLPQMVIFGLPSLLCLGLATFVTPFVILAARWRST
jgi:hypothetical protein